MSKQKVIMLLLFILSISLWGLSKLWGGGVTTSEIDHSGPRINCLMLRTLIKPPPPILLPSYVLSPLSSSPSCLRTWSSTQGGHIDLYHVFIRSAFIIYRAYSEPLMDQHVRYSNWWFFLVLKISKQPMSGSIILRHCKYKGIFLYVWILHGTIKYTLRL